MSANTQSYFLVGRMSGLIISVREAFLWCVLTPPCSTEIPRSRLTADAGFELVAFNLHKDVPTATVFCCTAKSPFDCASYWNNAVLLNVTFWSPLCCVWFKTCDWQFNFLCPVQTSISRLNIKNFFMFHSLLACICITAGFSSVTGQV